jgi:hypothetical protein
MQTFLPYASFEDTVQVLDYKRLGKQRVETFQILNVLLDRTKSKGWRNHPAKIMWEGFEEALKLYQNITITEWISRGYKNNMKLESIDHKTLIMPPWLGNEEFHKSHRSNLLRKDFEYYSQYFNDPIDLPYIWPVNQYA